MKVIKKYLEGNPITTSGNGYIPAAQPTLELLKGAANKLGEWFLKGLGVIGNFISEGLAYGSVNPNLLEPIDENIILSRKEAAGKIFEALSPLNYGVALATGNGLNPYAGEEEIATWEPYLQALARGLELYLTPKIVKGAKRGIQEVNYKLLPLRSKYRYPIGYDSNGKLYANKNYFFRQGWDLIDDAENTGVIRVPEGDYKPAVLAKYPFLDDGFSTMLESFKFPYFGKGSVSHNKFGIEPDLIAVPDLVPNTQWVGASKWGTLWPDVTPTFKNPRATPLYKGQTNKLPTSKTFRFRYNPETKLYEPVVGKVKFGEPSDFPEAEWTPFENWRDHVARMLFKIKPKRKYVSPSIKIMPVEGEINTGSSYTILNLPGYHIKGLMKGNPLEEVIGENGIIPRSVIELYIETLSSMELDLLSRVLSSKLFKNLNEIDYNTFRKAALNALPRLYDIGAHRIYQPTLGVIGEILAPFSLGDDYVIRNTFTPNFITDKVGVAVARLQEARLLKTLQLKGIIVDNLDLFDPIPTEDWDIAQQIHNLRSRGIGIGGQLIQHLGNTLDRRLIEEAMRREAYRNSRGFNMRFFGNTNPANLPYVDEVLTPLGPNRFSVSYKVRVPLLFHTNELEFKKGGKL